MSERFFYVSYVSGAVRRLIAGPYDTHAAALAQVDAARTIAAQRHPFEAAFGWWGTASAESWATTALGPNWPDLPDE